MFLKRERRGRFGDLCFATTSPVVIRFFQSLFYSEGRSRRDPASTCGYGSVHECARLISPLGESRNGVGEWEVWDWFIVQAGRLSRFSDLGRNDLERSLGLWKLLGSLGKTSLFRSGPGPFWSSPMRIVVVLSVLFVSLTAPLSRLRAQDEPPVAQGGAVVIEATATQGDDGEVVIGTTQAFAFTPDGVSQPMVIQMSPGVGMGFGGFGPGSDQLSMLGNEQIRNELQLADDQWKEVQQIQSDFRSRMRDTMNGLMEGGFRPERAGELKEKIEAVRTEMTGRLNQVLLPHQLTRLEQLGRHVQMKSSELGDSMFAGSLADSLNLTEEQKTRLRERAEELRAEMQAEMRKMQAEAREKLLEELTPEQREKLKELLGDEFDYQPEDPFARVRRTREETRRETREERESNNDR